jgi:ribosomal protein L37AE/L43A
MIKRKCIFCKKLTVNANNNNRYWLCKECLKKLINTPACKVNIDFNKIIRRLI